MKQEILKIAKKDGDTYEVKFDDKLECPYIFVPESSNSKKLKLAIQKVSADDSQSSKVDLTETDFSVISENAFANDNFITEIKLPKSLETIEKEAFKNCKSLKVVQCVSIKGKLKIAIQTQAFKDCERLESVVFGENVSFKKIIIEKGAFEGCSSLRTVYLNSTDCEISEDAFSGADNIVLAVKGNSSAERYAREHGIKYVRF